VFVHKLRGKLERASPCWRYIHTHWGLGYRFSAEPVEGSREAVDGSDEITLGELKPPCAPSSGRLAA
jgi:hypothetical protein